MLDLKKNFKLILFSKDVLFFGKDKMSTNLMPSEIARLIYGMNFAFEAKLIDDFGLFVVDLS